ncbi:MAG: phosphoribosylaminoimidazolesuccinocarboxamide synthase [Bacilli bacterium]|jgi:phosphoribosylaminoimidazole-succinocarboxamide synthase|nr:phosphoribosylaminoimidazolesuccinocarboxamide synthase [Bacilli bacterium]
MQQLDLFYEGKAKKIYHTDDPDLIIIHFKDDASAFNGIKKAKIKGKGIINNEITTIIFQDLAKEGIESHFVKGLNERDMLAKKLDIIPLEIVVRNVISGSMSKRLNLKEGTTIPNTIYELCLKNDKLGDPLLNRHHAVALGLTTYEDLDEMFAQTVKINNALKKLFASINITLVDFKIEFGKTKDGKIILADEISPDSCRLWDSTTKEILDKDRFRRDLGDVIQAYQQVLERLKNRK